MSLQYIFPCFFSIVKDCQIDSDALIKYAYENLDSGIRVSNVGGHQSYNINLNDPTVKKLSSTIENNVLNLCNELKVKSKTKISSMWYNINKKGNYNNAHSHSGFISGIFYVKTNSDSGNITFRHPAQLHPYFMKNVVVEEYHPAIANEWFFQPEDNDLFLFPSYLEHYVLPNNSDEDRISFAFNIDIVK